MDQIERIRKKIIIAFLASGLDEAVAIDIAFHMTDWKEDLDELTRLYEMEKPSADKICSTIIKFLAHVPNHLAAAKKLSGLGPIEDIFNVKVFEEDE